MEQNGTDKQAQNLDAIPAIPAVEEKIPRVVARRHRFVHKDVNHGQPSFAAGLNIYSVIWVFIIGCIIGVVWETTLEFLETGSYVRTAGMLYGPFNQVYGFGAVLFTLLLYRFRDRSALVIFMVSMLAGMVLEYAISWSQEMIFHSTSWDYSNMASSIGGRTNVKYGVGWGLMGLWFITRFWPWVSEMIQRIPNTIGRKLTVVLAVFLTLNMALSGAVVWRAGQRHLGVPANNAVSRWLDDTYPDTVIDKKYPALRFSK